MSRSGSPYSTPRDANRVPLLIAASTADGVTPVVLEADPATHALVTSGGSGSSGTQYTDGAAAPAHPIGTEPVFVNGSGNITAVSTANPLPITGTISVGSTTDESAFTAGSSTTGPVAGVFNDSVANLTSGQQGTTRSTAARALHTNLRNNSGTEIGTSTTPIQVSLANTAANATAVKVDGSTVTQPVSLASSPLPTGAATAANQTNASQKTQIVDGSGNVVNTLSAGAGQVGLGVSLMATNFPVSTGNSTVAQLTAGSTFTGTIESIATQPAISVIMTSDQNGTLTLNQYIDAAGTFKVSSWIFSVVAGIPYSRSFAANGNYFNLTFKNNGGSTTTTLNISTAYGTIQPATNLGNEPTSVNEINGTAISTGNGTTDAGTARVSLSSDSTGQVKLAAGTAAIGSLTAGSAVIGHVIADSGSTTAVTQATAANLNATVVGTGTFAVQATLAAETTKVIGTVNQGTSPWLVNSNSATGAAIPANAFYIAGTDGTNLQGVRTLSPTDAQANTISVVSAARGQVWNGATWDRMSGDTTGINVKAIVGALPAGTALIGKVGIDQTTPGTTNAVVDTPVTSGGLLIVTGSVGATATAIKASAGQLYGYHLFNTTAAVAYVQIFNVAAGSVTLGTTAPTISIGIPASGGVTVNFDKGIAFSTAISFAGTTTRTGASGATVDCNFFYK